jgi:hypothetical protein
VVALRSGQTLVMPLPRRSLPIPVALAQARVEALAYHKAQVKQQAVRLQVEHLQYQTHAVARPRTPPLIVVVLRLSYVTT